MLGPFLLMGRGQHDSPREDGSADTASPEGVALRLNEPLVNTTPSEARMATKNEEVVVPFSRLTALATCLHLASPVS